MPREEDKGSDCEKRDREQCAKHRAKACDHKVLGQVLFAPILLDRAGRIEMDFIFHKHGAEDADGEIPIPKCLMSFTHGKSRDHAASERFPVRTQKACGHRRNHHGDAGEAENSLDPLELQKSDDETERHGRGRE